MRHQENTDAWDEYDWERMFRESNAYAAKFLKLLKRFSDLPGGDDLITRNMADFGNKFVDCDFDCENCDERFNCDIAEDIGDIEDDDFSSQKSFLKGFNFGSDEEDEEEEDLHTGDDAAMFVERDQVFVLLRQTAMGWCNVYAAILPPELHLDGLRVLFFLGRSLSNLACALDEEFYNHPAASIALSKRCLWHLNLSHGIVTSIAEANPHFSRLMQAISKHLLQGRDGVLNHMRRFREKLRGDENMGID